jgi:uncharacterized protein (DUF2062 family)
VKRWIPTREELKRSRWLGPVAHHLEDDRLWHLERGSVARGVAIGLFYGFMLPFAQFLFAVATAIWLRGHVAIAAASTLVSNPLTFPPIYWLAYRIGRAVLGEPPDDDAAASVEARAETELAHQGWLAGTWDTFQAAGAPLLIGLALLAVVSSAAGFALVWLLWRQPPRADTRG